MFGQDNVWLDIVKCVFVVVEEFGYWVYVVVVLFVFGCMWVFGVIVVFIDWYFFVVFGVGIQQVVVVNGYMVIIVVVVDYVLVELFLEVFDCLECQGVEGIIFGVLVELESLVMKICIEWIFVIWSECILFDENVLFVVDQRVIV